MNEVYDVAIIGAGPAGVVAANMLSTKGQKVLLLEKGKDLLRRRDLLSGWFGRGLYGMNRLRLDDPALRNKKVFREALVLVQRLSQWKDDFSGLQYCDPPAGCGREIAASFYDTVLDKADVKFLHEVESVIKDKYFHIKTNKGDFVSLRCVIATGRNSLEWIKEMTANLGIECSKGGAQIGVRVELPSTIASKAIDPKEDIQMATAECNSICKNSFVSEWEDSGVLSAFGCTLPGKRSERTNFMVGFVPNIDTNEIIRTIQITNVLANDKIRRERVLDYMEHRSILEHLDVFNGLCDAFVELQDAIPMFIDYAMMYIPEIKLYGIFPVNAKMKTKMPGLYGAGECTTRATTIIGAMASGLIVSRTILGEL